MEVVRKDIDAPNVTLTQAMNNMLQWNLPLIQMQYLADLDVLIKKFRGDYDKLKKSKLAAMGGTFTDKGIPQFPDDQEEKAREFTELIIEYFEDTEALDFGVMVISVTPEIKSKLNGAIISGLKDFVKFVEPEEKK